jgi:hypothetical protein
MVYICIQTFAAWRRQGISRLPAAWNTASTSLGAGWRLSFEPHELCHRYYESSSDETTRCRLSINARTVRLHIPNDGDEDEYIALSHCWCSTLPLRTTTVNFPATCSGIEFSSLSQNFQDAVTVAWEFAVRYLWILRKLPGDQMYLSLHQSWRGI